MCGGRGESRISNAAGSLLALGFVEVLLDLGFVEVFAGHRREAGSDLLARRLLVGLQVVHGYPDAPVAYVVRMLGDQHVHVAPSQVLDLRRRSVEGHYTHLVLLARLPHPGSGALPGEDVGAEDTLQVGVRSEGRGGDRCRLDGIVVAVLGPEVLDVRVLLYRLLKALLPLVGGGDAGRDADDHDLALFTD